MSKTFTATQAQLNSLTRNSKGGSCSVTFQLNGRLSKSLGWPDLPENTGEWTPELSSFQATIVEFEPNADGLKKFKFDLQTTKLTGLQVQRKAEKQGKNARKAAKMRTEVACTLHFSQEDGCAKLERFLQSGGPCSIKVHYVDAPVQDSLPGTGEDGEDKEDGEE